MKMSEKKKKKKYTELRNLVVESGDLETTNKINRPSDFQGSSGWAPPLATAARRRAALAAPTHTAGGATISDEDMHVG